MSTAQQIEWLNLVEKTGPFLAVGVLDGAFPQGLEKVETRKRQRVRSAYDEWRDAVDSDDPQLDSLHLEWLRLVHFELLEYDHTVLKSKDELPGTVSYHEPLSGAVVYPDWAVLADGKPRILIATYGSATDLNAPLTGESWSATPIERMIALCRALKVQVGIVTNGEEWTLVGTPANQPTSIGTWYARIWQQEPVTLQAFVSLLDIRRCFGPTEGTLETLFVKSLEHQSEVTDTLGEQVRRAVEVLVQALDRADLDRNRELLREVLPAQLYEAALTVMMRLVVLLCAEERKLLLLGEPIYDQHYAVSTLRSRLMEEKERLGEEVLERRHDAWSRLLAVFRVVFGGIEHETLRLPALGGSLFDPDRFPFLEGRAAGTSWHDVPAIPLPIDNRTVLMLLTALQVLEHSSGAQLLSYEALDAEQIGHVYEGLLERTVKRVPETTLGLIGSQKAINPNVALRDLEEMQDEGSDELLAFLLEKTGRSESGLKNALAKPVDEPLYHRIFIACGGDIPLTDRVKPFAHLLRTDSWGDPLAYREESFIVTLGAGRRETGTHYTPKSLTEPIVQHTLEPLVYIGPAEGKLRAEWNLRTPAELLALKVCDMAMGSGAFLVQTCRWLGERLVEAWATEEKAGRAISVEGVVLDQPGDTELMPPRDKAERVLIARRLIASRCLYGVDINPMAVELAKLSLWLITMMRNRPFSFLDHALKCGDSLLGINEVKQLERFSVRDPDHAQPLLETANLWRYIEQTAAVRRQLEDLPSHTAAQIEQKARLHAEAEAQLARLTAAANFLVAAEITCSTGQGWETRRAIAASQMQAAWRKETTDFKRLSLNELEGRRPFHWPLEFPEVFDQKERSARKAGFDVFVGNPPFVGGRRIRETFGDDYRDALYKLYTGSSGNADLCAFFFLRGFALLASPGAFGLLATNTIAQGDTRQTGLDRIVANGAQIYRARNNMPWPGVAAVVVNMVHIGKGCGTRPFDLDGQLVSNINPSLEHREPTREPDILSSNTRLSFQGSLLRGMGFVIETEEAQRLIAQSPANGQVVQPFLNGDDLNSNADQSASRWVINFFNWPLERAATFTAPMAVLRERVYPERMGDAESRVTYGKMWWQFWRPRTELYSKIAKLRRVIVVAATSRTLAFAFCPTDIVFSHATYVFAFDSAAAFGLLQSGFHEAWAREYAGSLKGDLRYTSDLFEAFPFPSDLPSMEDSGERYYNHRHQIMLRRNEGLTKTYNRFHNFEETAPDIAELRALHCQLDAAVAAAYGWTDLAANDGAALGHDFHETKQGLRFTLAPAARREVLDRLLALNHQRYAEEVAAGMHDKKTKKGKKSRRATSPAEQTLF